MANGKSVDVAVVVIDSLLVQMLRVLEPIVSRDCKAVAAGTEVRPKDDVSERGERSEIVLE